LISRRYIIVVAAGLAVALLVALFSPLASSDPDGLEKVAEDKGFIGEGEDAPYEVIADYVFPGVENEDAATILAGVVGVAMVAVIVFAVAFGLHALSRRVSSPAERGPPQA
jgi:hypothetical protein